MEEFSFPISLLDWKSYDYIPYLNICQQPLSRKWSVVEVGILHFYLEIAPS